MTVSQKSKIEKPTPEFAQENNNNDNDSSSKRQEEKTIK